LGDFSPIGRLFALGFFENDRSSQTFMLLFLNFINFDKTGVRPVWANFSQTNQVARLATPPASQHLLLY
jgi:hypothetical protein